MDEFCSNKLYDIIIAEGWPGGFIDYEKDMLVKLSSFLNKGGFMMITLFSPIGALATYLRRLIGHRIIYKNDQLKTKTNVLKKALSSHLNKLESMSRSHEHWIQDSYIYQINY